MCICVANQEKIEASDDDVEKELEKMAQMYNMELDKVKSFMREEELDNLKRDIRVRKAVDLLTENAQVKKKAAKKAPAKAKKEAAEEAEKPAEKKTTKAKATKKKADADDDK